MIGSNNFKYSLLLAVLTGFALLGCLKREEYPDEPSVTFKRIDFDEANNATLYIDFIDGNGDFGLEQGEHSNNCDLGYNLFIEQYALNNGIWINVTPDPCLNFVPLYYAVPWARPTGQIQTQKGEIKVELFDNWYQSVDYDTLRFEIRIRDRALNTSNRLVTENYYRP